MSGHVVIGMLGPYAPFRLRFGVLDGIDWETASNVVVAFTARHTTGTATQTLSDWTVEQQSATGAVLRHEFDGDEWDGTLGDWEATVDLTVDGVTRQFRSWKFKVEKR